MNQTQTEKSSFRPPTLALAGFAAAAIAALLALAPGAGAVPPPEDEPVASQVHIKPYRLKHGRAPITGRVLLAGSVSPWRKGQRVQILLYHNGKRVQIRRAGLKKGKGNFGVFRTSIITKKGGRYGVRARYMGKGGADAVKPGSTIQKHWKVSFPKLHRGECGRVVRGFRRALNRLAMVPGGGKCFDSQMARAVLAYRKVNGMSRNASAPKSLVQQVFNGKGRYHVKKPGLGKHVEAPLGRQVIVFAKGKRPYAIFPIASGKSSTPTILGTYRFYWKDPGYNSLGMYYSSYFIRGYAIHGYAEVPDYPASHGCLRTFISDQPRIYNMTELGMPIATFGNAFRSRLGGERWSTAGDLGPDLGPAGGLDPAH